MSWQVSDCITLPCSTFDVLFIKRQPSEHRSLYWGCQVSGHGLVWFYVRDGMTSAHIQACPFLPLIPPAAALQNKINWMLNKHMCWIIEALRPEQALISIQALWTQSAQWQEDHWMTLMCTTAKSVLCINAEPAKLSEACKNSHIHL